MRETPIYKEDSIDYFDTMVVWGMRSAAHTQRSHQKQVRSEAGAVVQNMLRESSECRDAARRKRKSSGIAKARRRDRRRRALQEALRPGRKRARRSAGVSARRDTFDVVQKFASAEWGRGKNAEAHLERTVGELRWRVMEGRGGPALEVNLPCVLAARGRLAKRK